MEHQLFAWAGLALDTMKIVALGAVLCQLFRLRRDIMAMLRVVRRIDRKLGDTTPSVY